VKLRFLGTGTSFGVPRLRCRCAVCVSTDPRDRRRRTSALLTAADGRRLLFDCGPDFRAQALAANLDRLDAVFVTHAHADHMFGLDDLRGLTDEHAAPLPVAANDETADELERVYRYVFVKRGYPGVANLKLVRVSDGVPARIGGFDLLPFAAPHGPSRTFGARVGAFGYLVDVSAVDDAVVARLRGLDVLVLDLLRPAPHPTHLHLDAAVDAARRIGAARTYFVHMGHEISHAAVDATLPLGMKLAYDDLEIDVAD
jgi:phosphoribosyl 1,2-cyclic phosphate phosphodiesterase